MMITIDVVITLSTIIISIIDVIVLITIMIMIFNCTHSDRPSIIHAYTCFLDPYPKHHSLHLTSDDS